MTAVQTVKPLIFTRSTLPQPAGYADTIITIVEPDGSRGQWVSNGAAWLTIDQAKILMPTSPLGNSILQTIGAMIQANPAPAPAPLTNVDATKVTGLPNNQTLAQFAAAVNTFMQGTTSPPTFSGAPTSSGTPVVNTAYTFTFPTVTPAGGKTITSLTYQVNRQSATTPRTAIPLALGTAVSAGTVQYIPSAADFQPTPMNLSITITALQSDGQTASITSIPTAAVTGTIPGNTVAPSFSPSGTQPVGTVVTMGPGMWNVASCTFGFQLKNNGVPLGPRSSTATHTVAAGEVLTYDVIATSPLGVPSGLTGVAGSNSVTAATAATVTNSSFPTLTGTTSGSNIGIIQASAVDTNGPATSLNNVLTQPAANGNFRMGLLALTTKTLVGTSMQASPGPVAWSPFAVTDGTGGGFPSQILAYHPAAYTNLDTSALASFVSANGIAFYFESDIIDGSAGLLAGIIGESVNNAGLVWASPSITGLTGDIVFVECVYTGGGASEGLNNGGDATRIALTGAGITAGHHGNATDGDDMYVQYRTVLGVTAGQSFSGAGGFVGNNTGLQGYSAMILAFRKKAAGAGNNIIKGQVYNIANGGWLSGVSPIAPTSRTEDIYVNGAHPAGYTIGATQTTYTVDNNVAVGQTVQLVETAIINGVPYTSPLTGAPSYIVIAGAATFAAVLDLPSVTVPSGTAVSPFTPVRFINGTAPYTITSNPAVGTLGLAINPGTGAFTGTPSTPGVYTITVNGLDAALAPASQTFQLVIQAAQTLVIYAGTDASKSLSGQGGSLQYGGAQYPLISSLSDAIGQGFVPAGAALVNNSPQRYGKVNSPVGDGKIWMRNAIHPSDPAFENDTSGLTRRMDAYYPAFYNEGDVMWASGLFCIPAASLNYAGSFGVQGLEVHGSSDGNGFYTGMRNFAGKKYVVQVVRGSAGGEGQPNGYDTFDLSAWINPDVAFRLVVRQFYSSNGAFSRTQAWVDGVLRVDTNVITWVQGQNNSYPKGPWYNGNATVQPGGSWGYFQKVLYYKDNAQQLTESVVRANLG